ncbi:TetR/AcrR family transcriptional regulator [Tsukamurella sputi]|uniref:TetR/AcrR family transcriptional regulator n=1 Tax=Tsukamurella sputi TaxID=2591848 RepID=A0A5C5RKV5_9ACTN|nr:TetR/AcrR family transcriptional regulator [Tsukamurella sputi]TWS22841.1 TetR/AcrR family transcriptional regulator [Tsukamurella sputi]
MTRAARRRRNPEETRAALVDSALALLSDGGANPTAREIAAHAGASERTLYVHFPTLDDLQTAAAAVQADRVRARIAEIAPDQPLALRIDAAVAQSAAIYELQRHVRAVGLVSAARVPAIDASMAGTESRIRANWARTFAPELDGPADPGLLDAIDTVLAWSTLFHLAERLHLPDAECTRIQAHLLSAVFAASAGH